MVRVELSLPSLDYASAIRREAITFNRFVKPREGAIWNENSTSIHGLHSSHPSIIGADDMDTV